MNRSSPAGSAPAFVRAGPTDLEVVLPFVRAYYAFDHIPFDEGSVRGGLRSLLEDESLGGAWLVHDGGEAAGFFIVAFGFDLECGGRQATLTDLYLRPESRRRGLGTATLRYVEGLLAGKGIRTLELLVERTNHGARAFYDRYGFTAYDRILLSRRVSDPRKDGSR
jgi:ribosomal protein S18 acetylase RimI-like enzyme